MKSQKILKCYYPSPCLINVYQNTKFYQNPSICSKDIDQNAILNINQGPQLCNNKIYPSSIPRHSFPISTLMQSLKKIGKEMPTIENENQFLTSIKGQISVLICRSLPICNPTTLLPNINSYTKFEENWLKIMYTL